MPNTPTLASLAADLDSGAPPPASWSRNVSPKSPIPRARAQRAFIHVDKDAALDAADAMDRLRKANAAPSPYAGIPVSIKDLFDIKGQVTRAGSRALEDSAPAEADAPVVARLRRAGFVVIGRTNMTEFAYSGIGINPHYGTPKSAWNRSVGHVPGGSSSGAAVSVADGMALWRARHRYRRLLPDSGGLQRHRRLQADASAACRSTAACRCRSRSTVLGRWRAASPAARCWMPCSPTSRCSRCSRARSRACGWRCRPRSRSTISTTRSRRPSSARWRRCRAQGALIERIEVPEFLDVGVMNAKGGFAAAESYAWHRYLIVSKGDVYDPRVSRPHPARRRHQRRRLYRSAQRAALVHRAHGSAHRAL